MEDRVDKRNIYLKGHYIVFYILGVIEVLLAFRFVFKLLGANPQSGFVGFIYSISEIFVAPFFSIFKQVLSKGAEVPSVLEPATLIAMFVYAVIFWGIAQLIKIAVINRSSE